MMRLHLAFAVLVLIFAGCVDTVDSVAREYRNANNEIIDAMMMVTSDARAEGMMARIFKPSSDRYEAIDKKLGILVINRTKKELVKEVFESEGVHMYLTELEVNRQRFALELTRIRNLHKQMVDDGRECQKIEDVINKGEALNKIRDQLEKPELVSIMNQFRGWKIDKYAEMLEDFHKRRQVYELKKDIILVAPKN